MCKTKTRKERLQELNLYFGKDPLSKEQKKRLAEWLRHEHERPHESQNARRT